MMTYVADRKIRSVNPGFCFKCADWLLARTPDGKPKRSADGKKTLLTKPFRYAGIVRPKLRGLPEAPSH